MKFIAKVEVPLDTPPPADDMPEPPEPNIEPGGWAVAAIPQSEPVATGPVQRSRAATPPPAPKTAESARYGESVVREILGASFIEEQPHIPRVIPRGE